MIEALARIGDSLLDRIVPRASASAAVAICGRCGSKPCTGCCVTMGGQVVQGYRCNYSGPCYPTYRTC